MRIRNIVLMALLLLVAHQPAQGFPAPVWMGIPRSYVCERAAETPIIDGLLNDHAWESATWTEEGKFDTDNPEARRLDITHEEWEPRDKEPVWAWNVTQVYKRIFGFYDKKNKCLFRYDGKRNGDMLSHYAPFTGELPDGVSPDGLED